MYPGLMIIKNNLNIALVCRHCFYQKGRSLVDCVKVLKNSNNTNYYSHLFNKHRDVPKVAKLYNSIEAKNENKVKSETAQMISGASVSVSTSVLTSTGNKSKGGTLTSFYTVEPSRPTKEIGARASALMYQFLNSSGTAIRHGSSKQFHDLLRFCVDNAQILAKNSNFLKLSRQKFHMEQLKSFSRTIHVVRLVIQSTRKWYADRTRSDDVAFLNVAHDIWDGKDYELLGVSVHFVVPYLWSMVSIPLGLRRSYSKKSIPVLDEINKTLARYGIKKSDVFRGVNDTTASALKTGRLLRSEGAAPLEGGTSCGMHTVDLVIKHATGMVNRKSGGVIVDSFAAGKILRDKVKALASYLMDKKSKQWWINVVRIAKCFKMMATKLEIPNLTRVSGFYRMLISVLRMKTVLQVLPSDAYFSKDFKDKALTAEEWSSVAEFEAVLHHANVLAMESQREQPGQLAFSWIEVSLAQHKLKNLEVLKVIDTSRAVSSSSEPRIEVPKANIQPITVNLLDRFERQFVNYFPHPDSDQIIAMMVHPVVISLGLSWLSVLDKDHFAKGKLPQLRKTLFDFLYHVNKKGISVQDEGPEKKREELVTFLQLRLMIRG